MAEPEKTTFRAAELARIAVFSAVIIVLLAMLRMLPVADFFFYCGASVALSILYLEGGPREALYGFIVSSVIALFYPGPAFAWPYYLFFGTYPLCKFPLEKIGSRGRPPKKALACRLAYKGLYALLPGLAGLAVLHFLLPGTLQKLLHFIPFEMNTAESVLVLLLLWLLFFYVYETCLSFFLMFYVRRLGRKKKR